MASLVEMAALRDTFVQLGVIFEPVSNYDTLWEI
jgi:hypothetical protein